MHLCVSGNEIPGELFTLVSSITDRAVLRHVEVTHDSEEGVVRLPLIRLPLVKKRDVLPNVHDRHNPTPCVVTVRNVVSCDIQRHVPPGVGDEVHLIFGIQFEDNRVYASSAEEDRGETCFTITVNVSEIDLEITDVDRRTV